MRYRIVMKESTRNIPLEKTAEELSTEVNELIQEGWEPLGGIAAGMRLGQYPFLAQAMLKKD